MYFVEGLTDAGGTPPSAGELLDWWTAAAAHKLQIVADTVDARIEGQHIAVGNPAAEILALARKLDSDVIIVGSHARRRFLPAMLGSTASRVVRHAPVPVWVVRWDPTDLDELGTDDLEGALSVAVS